MAQFAATTEVPVEKTRAEIEGTVVRYGAKSFTSGWREDGRAFVSFDMHNRRLRFLLSLPSKDDKRFTEVKHKNRYFVTKRTPEQALKAWEQACRQLWRALLLSVKAKLEAVESGIGVFDQEFMAHVVMPDGKTVGEHMLPKMNDILSGRPLPPLLTE